MKRDKNRTPYKRPREGYTEENWKRWSNAQRCAYVENQFEVLSRDNCAMARKYGITDAQLEQMRQDAAALRKLADAEENARKTLTASAHMAMEKEEKILFDMLPKKGVYLPPSDILGKKGN